MLKRISSKIRIMGYVPLILGILLFTYLSYYSFRYSYSFNTNYDQTMFEKKDQPLFHLFSLLFVFILVFCCKKLIRVRNSIIYKTIIFISVLSVFAIGLWWVLISKCMPFSDQKMLLDSLDKLISGDYTILNPIGYFGAVKHQLRMATLFRIFTLIPNIPTYFVIQLINAVCLPLFLFTGVKLLKKLYDLPAMEVFFSVLCVLYLPLYLYTPFVYGEILSLLFGNLLFYFSICFFKSKKKKYLLLSALFSILGFMARGNFLIIIIATSLILILCSIEQKKLSGLLLAGTILIAPFCANKGIMVYYETISQQPLDQGIPSISWIAMGLGTGYNGRNGWYNGFIYDTYGRYDRTTKGTYDYSLQLIHDRIAMMKNGADSPAVFYKEKILTQWNEPTAEGFCATNGFYETTPFTENVYCGHLHIILENFMNESQFILYLGMLFFCVFSIRNKCTFFQLLHLTAIIGGFLFTILWEASSRYVFPYTSLLLFGATYGWYCLFLLKKNDILTYLSSFRKHYKQ